MNRLEEARNKTGETSTYQYNGLGHRVGKTIQTLSPNPKQEIRYTLDLTRQYHNLLQMEEKNRKQTFLWDGNVAGVLEGDMGEPGYYLQDDLGSPIRLLNAEGSQTEAYGYDEFGRDLCGNQGEAQPFGYTGYQHDRVAGTYYAQAREYLPGVGRFAGQDPIKGNLRNVQTQNLYHYCLNQPIRYIDPTGKCEEDTKTNEAISGFSEQLINHMIDPVNYKLWAIDGAFSAISVYKYITKRIPEFRVNVNNRHLINVYNSVNYSGGRGGVRRISKMQLWKRAVDDLLSMNEYIYCRNAPEDYVDWDGQAAISIAAVLVP